MDFLKQWYNNLIDTFTGHREQDLASQTTAAQQPAGQDLWSWIFGMDPQQTADQPQPESGGSMLLVFIVLGVTLIIFKKFLK